jgi:hypothetical protein
LLLSIGSSSTQLIFPHEFGLEHTTKYEIIYFKEWRI